MCLAPIWARTDLAPGLLASDLASHQVPGTDLAPALLASSLALRHVPGTDLGSHRFGIPVC
jgi:hypothetical protein